MAEIQEAGWKQCEKVDDKSGIKEEEIKALFDMIDKDGSGSLTRRVSTFAFPFIYTRYQISWWGSQKIKKQVLCTVSTLNYLLAKCKLEKCILS